MHARTLTPPSTPLAASRWSSTPQHIGTHLRMPPFATEMPRMPGFAHTLLLSSWCSAFFSPPLNTRACSICYSRSRTRKHWPPQYQRRPHHRQHSKPEAAVKATATAKAATARKKRRQPAPRRQLGHRLWPGSRSRMSLPKQSCCRTTGRKRTSPSFW